MYLYTCEMRKKNGLFTLHNRPVCSCAASIEVLRHCRRLPRTQVSAQHCPIRQIKASSRHETHQIPRKPLLSTSRRNHSLARPKLLERLASKPQSATHLFETSTATYLYGVESRSDLHCVGTCIFCHGGQAKPSQIQQPLAMPSHEIGMLNQ